jgi:hypothetical protein
LCCISNNPISQEQSELWIQWVKAYTFPNEEPIEPVVDLYYPIVNTLSRIDKTNSELRTDANTTVVALITLTIYWPDLIRDILPEGSNGILVVVECPCNEQFTYRVLGPEVQFLGVGDLHEVKYNQLEKIGKPAEFPTSSVHKQEYSGLPLKQDFCPYTLHVYPSDLMTSAFKTSNGVIFMVSMVCIFAFISIVFYLYDRKVEQRQKRTVASAQPSLTIISSLFPSTVRDQLYKAQIEAENSVRPQWLQNPFMQASSAKNHIYDWTNGQAIAQMYQDTTVIFLNIVGFKQWSTYRPPTQIFQLLETIYAKFVEKEC